VRVGFQLKFPRILEFEFKQAKSVKKIMAWKSMRRENTRMGH